MIEIDTTKLTKGIDKLDKPLRTIAALAETSEGTLTKLRKGDTNLTLSCLDRIAGVVGYDVKVSFVPKPAEG